MGGLKAYDHSQDVVIKQVLIAHGKHVLKLVKENVVFSPYVVYADGERITAEPTQVAGLRFLDNLAQRYRREIREYGCLVSEWIEKHKNM